MAASSDPGGLLSESEALTIIRNHVLPTTSTTSSLVPYEKLRRDDVCQDHTVSFESHEAETLDADSWEAQKRVRAELSTVAPAAEVEIRMHVGSCKDSDCPASNVYRAGLMARVDLGEGLEVTREYAL